MNLVIWFFEKHQSHFDMPDPLVILMKVGFQTQNQNENYNLVQL
jgi:hypothetical protein